MRKLLYIVCMVVFIAALAACELPRLDLGNDSDARLTCRASVSVGIRGIKVRCGSELRSNDFLRNSGQSATQSGG